MARPKKRQPTEGDPLAAYRRVRKPLPPPDRVIPDKRRKLAEREAERERRSSGNT